MTNDENARIKKIRSRTQKERALIAELNAQLDVELSKMLELASSLLDDVEEFFLDAELLQEPGSGLALAKMLRHSEKTLGRVEQVREHIKDITKKFGLNAKIIKG